MTAAQPNLRRPIWQGVQDANGLWFDAEWLDADTRTTRMLEAWSSGCRAWRFAQGDVLCFPHPRRMACERASGRVLCLTPVGLCSGPISESERAALPPRDVGVVRGAQWQGLSFSEGEALDLSRAIDVGAYALHDTWDFTPPLPRLDASRLEGKDVRKVLGDAIPPRSAETERLLRKLRGESTLPDEQGDGLRARGSLLGTLRDFFGLFSVRVSASGVGSGGRAQKGVRQRTPQAKPSSWRAALARVAMFTRVSRLLGLRQGAHLRRMMRMFEDGNLHEALRNALPLGGLDDSLGQAFGGLARREHLGLTQHRGVATSIGLDDELQAHLQQLYRAAFARLDREGKVDEAVYVLAELLNSRAEALDYLVKHKRQAQAAELALNWEMAPALTIRLLMLAGDRERAVLVARRDGAFSAAVQAMGKDDAGLIAQLRIEWGQALVESGDWLAAVDAIWPVQEARRIAAKWLEQAEAADEVLSARALVQRAVLLPDTLDVHGERIDALADPAVSSDARTAMAEAMLAASGNSPALRRIASALLPAIAADRAAGRNAFSRKALDRMLRLAADPLLRADMPDWHTPPVDAGSSLWSASTQRTYEAPAAGLHAAFDVVALPHHRYLVALGEIGVAVVSALGKVLQRYPVPATRLVIAHSGGVALALASREDRWRVSRLDLVAHGVVDLGVLELQHFAPEFDGLGWSVVIRDRIVVLDVTAPDRPALWHVGDLGGSIFAAGYLLQREVYLVHAQGHWLDWSFALPNRRRLAPTEYAPREGFHTVIHSFGTFLQFRFVYEAQGAIWLELAKWQRQLRLCENLPAEPRAQRVVPVASGLAVILEFEDFQRCFIVAANDNRITAQFDWPATSNLQLRAQGDKHLLAFDDSGRILHVVVDTSVAHHVSLR